MNDDIEGTFDDWKQTTKEYENDTSIACDITVPGEDEEKHPKQHS